MAPQVYPRVAGRLNNIVNLNMKMLRNGIPTSPYAIRRIDIYRSSIRPGNIVASIAFPDPSNTIYPSPAVEDSEGEFSVPFLVPSNFVVDDVYFDVWHFISDDPATDGIDDENLWISQNGMFWVFEDVWLSDDDLLTKRLGFEPLDKKFRRGEVRKLEVALHPLPKYNYDFNHISPTIPQLSPTISISTPKPDCELLVKDASCQIGVRQGAHRNSPFVVQCLLDTRSLLRGTYEYVIKVNIGSQTLMSPKFYFTVQ